MEDFRTLTDVRLKEAQALLDAGLPSGSYYLAGYSVECALKAVITKGFTAFTLPDKSTVEQAYVHSYAKLLGLASLAGDHAQLLSTDPAFAANWSTIGSWTEAARYEQASMSVATDAIAGLTDPNEGVIQWIKKHW